MLGGNLLLRKFAKSENVQILVGEDVSAVSIFGRRKGYEGEQTEQ